MYRLPRVSTAAKHTTRELVHGLSVQMVKLGKTQACALMLHAEVAPDDIRYTKLSIHRWRAVKVCRKTQTYHVTDYLLFKEFNQLRETWGLVLDSRWSKLSGPCLVRSRFKMLVDCCIVVV
jgi:hypothetical protein